MARHPVFKFLHAADLHLDSPLRGLDRYEGAPVEAIRQATRRAVEHLVDLAIAEKVAFVVIAGDVYDGDWPDYNTGLYFTRQMARLGEAGIDVFLIRGNHDAESVITRSLSLPDNVVSLATDKPQTVEHESTGSAIHGQGFATRAVKSDLAASYPAARKGRFNLGVLHTSAGGSAVHDTYAPCTVDSLKRHGYDYWALGHIHQRQVLCEDDAYIAFSGNTQGRHIRETGAKGCLLVTVDDTGRPTAQFRSLDVFRWELCETSAVDCSEPEDILDAVRSDLRAIADSAEHRPLGVRVQVIGRSDAHESTQGNTQRWTAELLAAVNRDLGDQIWIEKIRFATSPPDDEPPDLPDGPLAELRQHLSAVRSDEALLSELTGELADLRRKLPADLASSLDDRDWLRSIAAESEQMLFSRLLTHRDP